MELKRFTKQVGLAEIAQSMGTTMAILSKIDGGFEQRTPPVKCRDFLCDCYSSILQKVDFSIYGMSWKGTTDTLDWDGVYLLLKFPNTAAKVSFFSNLGRLHAIEDVNKIHQTKVTEVSDLEVVVEGDKTWLQNVLSFSLYTLLLRIFCYKLEKEDWITEFAAQSHSDSKYIKNWPRSSLDAILNDLTLLQTKEWNGLTYQTDGNSGVHHNSGAVSCFSHHSEQSQSTVKKNKHWQEMREKGLETYVK